jgi:ubiquinone/menaquinone biosynthesis C-methylase UbiE
MGIYSDYIFPKFFDCIVSHVVFDQRRADVLAGVKGKILEVGIGTGLNLKHYPASVTEIWAIDPNPGMKRQLINKHRKDRIKVNFELAGAESLPFADETFDTVVSTLTFCTIPDLQKALSEMKRVLKAKGKIIFLEHGLSPDPDVAKWQYRLNPIQKIVGCGCSLTVSVHDEIKRAGLGFAECRSYYIERAPKFIGHVFEGVAHKI